MKRLAALLLVPALVLSATPRRPRRGGPVSTAAEAKAIAEREVGGTAVHAHRIPLNGASSGWEVEVHMPNEDRGWRCVIDSDTHMVHTKERIPNPKTGRKR
ncbi:MAG: PepSY domain-containing protein [Firmicutes bacterium]|nr:PepSY domain-containing protein [Bacillota bacterium]